MGISDEEIESMGFEGIQENKKVKRVLVTISAAIIGGLVIAYIVGVYLMVKQ